MRGTKSENERDDLSSKCSNCTKIYRTKNMNNTIGAGREEGESVLSCFNLCVTTRLFTRWNVHGENKEFSLEQRTPKLPWQLLSFACLSIPSPLIGWKSIKHATCDKDDGAEEEEESRAWAMFSGGISKQCRNAVTRMMSWIKTSDNSLPNGRVRCLRIAISTSSCVLLLLRRPLAQLFISPSRNLSRFLRWQHCNGWTFNKWTEDSSLRKLHRSPTRLIYFPIEATFPARWLIYDHPESVRFAVFHLRRSWKLSNQTVDWYTYLSRCR